MGPEGGDKGGTIVGTGTPEELAKNRASYTGAYIVPVLVDGRSLGHNAPDATEMARLESENFAVLDDLAKGERVAVEA